MSETVVVIESITPNVSVEISKDQGPQGLTGATGATGSTGSTGATGTTGPANGTATPSALGTAAVGTSTLSSHEDHIHPTTGLAVLNAANTFTNSVTIPNPLLGYTTTTSSGTAIVLTATSNYQQYITGSTAQVVTLPVASTLTLGQSFKIVNNASTPVTINSSGGNLVISLLPTFNVEVTCILTSGTTAASWSAAFSDFDAVTGTAGPVVLSNSPTLVTPALGTPSAIVLTNATGLPISGIASLGTGVGTILAAASTGTGAMVAGTAPTISKPLIDNPLLGYTTTVSSATAIVLTTASNYQQYITGSTAQTITLPVASTMTVGQSFKIVNNNTAGSLTVNSSGGNLVITVPIGFNAEIVCILASGTTAASWSASFCDFDTVTGTGNVVLSTSPTLTTPALGTPSAVVLTSGTGLPISTGVSGLGTGIATALAVNTGSAGAPVLFNGALGTPTSGTLTNATGLPIAGTTGWGTGVATLLAGTSSGTVGLVGSTSPTITTPTLSGSVTATGALFMSGGVAYLYQPTPNAQNVTATITIANMLTEIITSTSSTAVSLTLPTGTLMDGGITGIANDESFDWSIINLGSASGAVTIVAGTSHTIVGSATVAITTSARFRSRRTAATTWVTYRIS